MRAKKAGVRAASCAFRLSFDGCAVAICEIEGAISQHEGAISEIAGAISQIAGANAGPQGAIWQIKGANGEIAGAISRLAGAIAQLAGAKPAARGTQTMDGESRAIRRLDLQLSDTRSGITNTSEIV
jgi:hypothetical protein